MPLDTFGRIAPRDPLYRAIGYAVARSAECPGDNATGPDSWSDSCVMG